MITGYPDVKAVLVDAAHFIPLVHAYDVDSDLARRARAGHQRHETGLMRDVELQRRILGVKRHVAGFASGGLGGDGDG